MTKLRLVTIGTSMITGLALDAFSQIDDYEIVGLYSRKKESAQKLADKFNIARIITDFEELKNDKNIDVVYVASPNGFHYQQSLELLKADKHVITEKPYVANIKEFESIKETVLKTKRFCFDAIMPIHLPNFKQIQKALDEIKPVHLMTTSQVQYSSRYDALLKGEIANIFDPKMAGGALMDLGVYTITDVVSLFGLPKDIDYICRKHENGIDLSGVLTLKYDDMNAVCMIGKDAQANNQTVLMGEKGTIVCEGSASTLKSCHISNKTGSEDISIEQVSNQMIYEMQDFANVIKTNDWTQYEKWMTLTKDVITVMEKARQKIDLVFPNDLV